MRRTAANCGKGGEVRQLRQMRQVAATAAKTTTPATSREIQGKSSRESQKAAPDPTALPIFSSISPNFLNLFLNHSSFISQFFSPNTITTLFSFPRLYSMVFTRWFPICETTLFALVFFGKREGTGKARRGKGLGDEWGRGGETTLFSVHIVGLFLFI